MLLNIDIAWLVTVMLVFLRLGVLFVVSPIFSSLGGLVTIRVLFSLALSVMLVVGLKLPLVAAPVAQGGLNVVWLALAAGSELVLGASMAFGVFAAFGAFSVAGKLLDIQTGLGMGNVYDPVTRTGSPLFATLLNLVAVAVFFGLDAHHAFIRGIAFSLQEVAPGRGLSELSLEPVLRQFGLTFSLGVALMIPVLLSLLLVEVGLAVISRTLPQMNILVVGIPIKIIAGVSIFAISIGTIGTVMGKIFTSIFAFWMQILH